MKMNETPNFADRVDRALDDALNMTFPASDPVAIFVPAAPVRFDSSKAPNGLGRSALSPATDSRLRR